MTLFMTEIRVRDLAVSLAWYRDVLGLTVTLLDAANGFALLDAAGGRLALKQGEAGAGVTLHFEVADLDAALTSRGLVPEEVVTSAEGYREAFVRDPDGYRVGVFEWVRPVGVFAPPGTAGVPPAHLPGFRDQP
jgi:catechol 2,3-dioxygenase-like lactoylglutathione lyase family enzyme